VPTTQLTGHVVLVGHGRVGGFIGESLGKTGAALLVIDSDDRNIDRARQRGLEAIKGNAADPAIIEAANLPAARCLLVAIPDAFEGGQVVDQAHKLNPALIIIARAHSETEIEHFMQHGATAVVMSEHEIAKAMIAGIPQVPA
jgi:CPA2 family monovalent cation:H+ antiporter-2